MAHHIVYIRRQSRLYKAVRGLVLTTSVCEVPSVIGTVPIPNVNVDGLNVSAVE